MEITEKEVVDFYDNVYYKTEKVHAIRPLEHYQKVFDFLKPVKSGSMILDVGCGTGLFLRAATDAGLEPYGIDIAPKAIEISKKYVPEAHLVVAKGEALPFENKFFDYVFYG